MFGSSCKCYFIAFLENYFFDSLYNFGFIRCFPPNFSEEIDDKYLFFLSKDLNFKKNYCEGFFYSKEFHNFEGGSFYRLYVTKINLKNIRDELENILVLRDIFENLNKSETFKKFEWKIKLKVNYFGRNEIEKNKILEFLDLHFEGKGVWDDSLNNDDFDGLYFEWFSERNGYEFVLASGGKRKNFDSKFSFFYVDIWELFKFLVIYRNYLPIRKVVLFFDKEDENILEFRRICCNKKISLICFERSSDNFLQIYHHETTEPNCLTFWYRSFEDFFRYYDQPIPINGCFLEVMKDFEELDKVDLKNLHLMFKE